MIDWTHPAQAALPGMTALRRAIHAEPELGLHNPRTAEKIMAALAGLPLEFRTGPSTTGIIATLKGPANGRTVLLRGDTDALPMPAPFLAPCTPVGTIPMSPCWPVLRACCANGARALPAA